MHLPSKQVHLQGARRLFLVCVYPEAILNSLWGRGVRQNGCLQAHHNYAAALNGRLG